MADITSPNDYVPDGDPSGGWDRPGAGPIGAASNPVGALTLAMGESKPVQQAPQNSQVAAARIPSGLSQDTMNNLQSMGSRIRSPEAMQQASNERRGALSQILAANNMLANDPKNNWTVNDHIMNGIFTSDKPWDVTYGFTKGLADNQAAPSQTNQRIAQGMLANGEANSKFLSGEEAIADKSERTAADDLTKIAAAMQRANAFKNGGFINVAGRGLVDLNQIDPVTGQQGKLVIESAKVADMTQKAYIAAQALADKNYYGTGPEAVAAKNDFIKKTAQANMQVIGAGMGLPSDSINAMFDGSPLTPPNLANAIQQGNKITTQPNNNTTQQGNSVITPNWINATISTESGGNPNAVSPKGAIGDMQTMPGTLTNPGFGVTPAKDNSPQELHRVGVDYMNALGQKYGNQTLASIAYNMGPGATDKWLASGGDFNKLPAETKNYVASVNTKAAVLDSASPNTAQQSTSANAATILPIGDVESRKQQAEAGGKRHDTIIQAAAESPTRINVLDNIIDLSKQGVQTGNGAEWQNTVKGYLANAPFAGDMFPDIKNDVSKFQEINKFMAQNAARNWQAAGGTGTDAQLAQYNKMNPNDVMFPQALQAMAEWGKAGELALQAKADAAQKWKDSQNGSVVGQDKFESQWRNAFDPKVFQYEVMSPDQKSAFVSGLSNAKVQDLQNKIAALKKLRGQ